MADLTPLQSAIGRILQSSLLHPDVAYEALGTVLGMLAARETRPDNVILRTMRVAVAVAYERQPEAPKRGVAPELTAWRP